jgi:hypothetical protein
MILGFGVSAMRRRQFISLLGGAAAWPLAARAQQVERLRRIGFLGGGTASLQPIYDGLLQGMRELGYRILLLSGAWRKDATSASRSSPPSWCV